MKGFVLGFIAFVIITLIFRLIGRRAAIPPSTYGGRWQDYRGPKALLVAVYIPGASVWRATAEVLAAVDRSLYDIQIIDGSQNPEAVNELGVSIFPTVVVVREGIVAGRFPNLMDFDALASV